ncbi:hypothetical protein [Endozoicomonas sp. ALB115]|uniref:hypothetical protein n=1 Tax=Endozoicomonas sp. ALB115 TaxID=3403074 RepID=UPI003BB6D156
MLKRLLTIALLTLLCLLAGFGAWAITPADTMILTQANASYFDTQHGTPAIAISNQSWVMVGAVHAFELKHDQNLSGIAGQQVYFVHRLTNLGNTADRYQLSFISARASGLTNLQVFEYRGALPAPGTPSLTQTRTLQPGENMQLIILATIPAGAANEESHSIILEVSSEQDNTVKQQATDQVTISDVAVRLNKTVSKDKAKAEDTLYYEIRYQILGNKPLPHGTTTIDGKPFHGILLEDILPPQTTLDYTIPEFAPYQAMVVLRLEDGNWQRFENWNRRLKPTRIGLMVPAAQLQPGQTGRLSFALRINPNVSSGTLIENRARLYNKLDYETVEARKALVVSNPAYTLVTEAEDTINPEPILRFIEPSGANSAPDFYGEFTPSSVYYLNIDSPATNGDVYLELEGGNFAQSRESIDTIESVTVRSDRGDSVRVKLQETAIDSGVFRSVSPLRLATDQQGNNGLCLSAKANSKIALAAQPDYSQPGSNCYLASQINDQLVASVQDPVTQQNYTARATVSPAGTVFSSDNLAPVAGSRVEFFNVSGNPALDENTRTQSNTGVSDANGHFIYPRLPEGRYFIQVTPPVNYAFPSKMAPAMMPGKKIHDASYGRSGIPEDDNAPQPFALARGGINTQGTFEVSSAGVEVFDVPVDAMVAPGGSLTLQKNADRDEIAPGERIRYELKLHNPGNNDLFNLSVVDTLPHGFKYVAGTTKIDGITASDPVGAPGPQLRFSPQAALASDDELLITYILQAGAGAIDSDGINRATATASKGVTGQRISSNEGKAEVTVRMTGVLSDKAILFGKVFLDSQCAGESGYGVQDSNDWPVGGVRLYMEDGTWVITDEYGQYSLMGLKPGNHVLKVDPVTLPDGLTLKPLDNRHGTDGNSRFVDLTPGEMHRADFAAQCPATDAIVEQIKARNESISGDWLLDDAAKYNRSKPSETADASGDLSNGVIRAPEANQQAEQKQTTEALPADSKKKETASAKIPLPKEAIKTVTRQQAEKGTFLWPLQQTADGRFMAVVRAGVQPTLYINGAAVANDRLGEQLLNNREQAQLLAWYGVSLQEGENRVEIKATDMFGNERLLAGNTFSYAGSAASIQLVPSANVLPADDGQTLLPVTVKLLDNHGLPARGIYFITLESTAGRWHETDIQDQEPGHQIRIDHGAATVNLRSGNETGPVTLRATTGQLSGEATITQVAPSRPLMAVGLVDINSGTMPDLLSATEDEKVTRTRAAMFVKGDIAKDTQLTLSYDSDKNDDAELFRDVDPDDYYPITGDASEKGYEAQSRSKLYAKIERGLNSIMWGDYQTNSQSAEYDLAKTQRNLTGINAIYDNGSTRIQTFAARPENSLRSEIIEPNGTAMNYRLAGAPIVRHSETITLEVWSRDNPGLMLSSTTLGRGSDYTLDEFSGYLKFTAPVNRRDDEGNPQKIRVSYEVEDDGEAYTVAGGRVQQKLGDQVTAGISYTLDQHSTEGSEIAGVWVEYQPTEKTTVAISSARMTGKTVDDNNPSLINEQTGNATRIKIKLQWSGKGETEITWAKADQHFTNSSGGVSVGREESSVKHKQSLTDSLDLRAEAEVSRSEDNSNGSGDNAGVYLDKRVGNGWQLTAGSRYIRQRSDEDHNEYLTVQAGVEKRFTLLDKDASLSAEYEQAFTDSRWRAAVESDWQVAEKVSVYGRFERDHHLGPVSGDSDRNEFSFGVKSDWLPNTDTYSEYRMQGATDGNQLEWVNGADTRLEVTEGLSLSPSVEWINTLSGDSSNDGLAISVGIDDKRHGNQRATGRIEYRYGQLQDYYGLDGAIARRLNRDWAGLIREQFRLENPKDGEGDQRLEHAFTLGLARRPKLNNVQHGLYLYQWKEERDENDDREEDRRVHLLSTHQNRKIRPGLTLSGRLGSKWVTDEFDGDPFDSQTTVFDGRLTWDLNRRWDMDLRSGLLSVNGDDSVRWSAGVGLNYLVASNLRVGVHYNIEGFRDDDLDSEKYNAEGVHLSLQFKFDESLFDWFRS